MPPVGFARIYRFRWDARSTSHVRAASRHWLRLGLAALVAGGLAGCGSSAGSTDSSEDRAAGNAYSPPEIAAADATFADELEGWSLLQTDEDLDAQQASAVYEDTDDSSRSIYVIVSTEYPLEAMEEEAAGLVLDAAHDIDGFTCGQSGSYGSTCYGPLTDGYVTVAGSYESQGLGVTFSEEEIAGITRDVYAMFSDPSTSATSRRTCDQVPIEELNAALSSYLNGGTLTIDEEYSRNEGRDNKCSLLLPDGAFRAEADETGYVGTLYVDAFAYVDNRTSEHGVYDAECTIGGSTPGEVFESAASCVDLVNETGGSNTDATVVPEGDGGVVTDGQIAFVLAPAGDVWYSGGLSGILGDASFNDALLTVADLLPSR